MTEQELLDFFRSQTSAIESRDLAALLDHYQDDAALVRVDRVASGRVELEALFSDYLALEPKVVGVDGARAAADTLVYQARLELGGIERRVSGAMIVRDGKIWRQVAFFDPPLE